MSIRGGVSTTLDNTVASAVASPVAADISIVVFAGKNYPLRAVSFIVCMPHNRLHGSLVQTQLALTMCK